MNIFDEAEQRVDDAACEYMAWTCAVCLGMFFPAQFEAILSRYYMSMTVKEQAQWMSCSTRAVKNLNKRALRNMRILARFITRSLECKDE